MIIYQEYHTIYHLLYCWDEGDVWWLHYIDCFPPHSGQVGDQYALKTHAGAQRIIVVLNSLRNSAATKSQLLRHRYVVSDIIAWWHRICVGVNI